MGALLSLSPHKATEAGDPKRSEPHSSRPGVLTVEPVNPAPARVACRLETMTQGKNSHLIHTCIHINEKYSYTHTYVYFLQTELLTSLVYLKKTEVLVSNSPLSITSMDSGFTSLVSAGRPWRRDIISLDLSFRAVKW